MKEEAKKLNSEFKSNLFQTLSKKGKEIYFPRLGLVSQSQDAKKTKINATAGIANLDDGTPMHLKSVTDTVKLKPEEIVSYCSSFGNPKLRELWKKEIHKKNKIDCDISFPIVTAGITQGINIVSYLFADEQTQIILPDLYWENYDLIFNLNTNSKITTFPMFNKGFNVQGLLDAVTKSKRPLIILNFPNNPSGYSPTEKEVNEIQKGLKKIAKNKPLVILFDDAYTELIYEKNTYKGSLFQAFVNLDNNILAIKADGATKENFAWGLRIGFLTFGSKGLNSKELKILEDKTAGVIRLTTSNQSQLSQSLVIKTIKSSKDKHKQYNILKKRYKSAKKLIESKIYDHVFTALPFNSGYFFCIKPNISPEIIRQELLKKNIGVIALNNIIRIAYSSTSEKNLKTILDKIKEIILEKKF